MIIYVKRICKLHNLKRYHDLKCLLPLDLRRYSQSYKLDIIILYMNIV